MKTFLLLLTSLLLASCSAPAAIPPVPEGTCEFLRVFSDGTLVCGQILPDLDTAQNACGAHVACDDSSVCKTRKFCHEYREEPGRRYCAVWVTQCACLDGNACRNESPE